MPNASGYIDPQLPMLNKVSSLVDVLHHSGSFDLVEWLWEQLVLTASRVNITVAWSQDEALVGSVLSPDFWVKCLITSQSHCFFSVHQSQLKVSAKSNPCCWLGDGTKSVRDRKGRLERLHLGLRENVENGRVHRCYWSILGRNF